MLRGPYGMPGMEPPVVIPEFRAKNNPWALPSVAPNQNKQNLLKKKINPNSKGKINTEKSVDFLYEISKLEGKILEI